MYPFRLQCRKQRIYVGRTDLLAGPQVSSLEARGRRQQKKGGSGMGSGGGNRRSKSENPLQRKLSVAQHLSLTTRPQVRVSVCLFASIMISITSHSTFTGNLP